MEYPGDVYVHGHVQPEAMRRALAIACGLPAQAVAIRLREAPWPVDVEAIVQPWDLDLPGDWPADFWLELPGGSMDHLKELIANLAQELALPIMTDAGLEDPYLLLLALPNGSTHEVAVEQADDGGFYDTPEMKRLIADGRPTPLRMAS